MAWHVPDLSLENLAIAVLAVAIVELISTLLLSLASPPDAADERGAALAAQGAEQEGDSQRASPLDHTRPPQNPSRDPDPKQWPADMRAALAARAAPRAVHDAAGLRVSGGIVFCAAGDLGSTIRAKREAAVGEAVGEVEGEAEGEVEGDPWRMCRIRGVITGRPDPMGSRGGRAGGVASPGRSPFSRGAGQPNGKYSGVIEFVGAVAGVGQLRLLVIIGSSMHHRR